MGAKKPNILKGPMEIRLLAVLLHITLQPSSLIYIMTLHASLFDLHAYFLTISSYLYLYLVVSDPVVCSAAVTVQRGKSGF